MKVLINTVLGLTIDVNQTVSIFLNLCQKFLKIPCWQLYHSIGGQQANSSTNKCGLYKLEVSKKYKYG